MPRDGVRLWTEGAQPHRAISLSSLVELRLYGTPRASSDESIKGLHTKFRHRKNLLALLSPEHGADAGSDVSPVIMLTI